MRKYAEPRTAGSTLKSRVHIASVWVTCY